MASRRTLRLLVAVALAAGTGCSKTQDTAPESRLFGSPPTIQNVNVNGGQGTASCDITKTVEAFMCELGLIPGQYTFDPSPTVVAEVLYSEIMVTARIVDPEDTTTKSDILLATMSFQTPPVPGQVPEETSLLMFDDGQANTFPHQQIGKNDDCVIDPPNGICGCLTATYQLTTNDVSAGDHIFTRGFAFVSPGVNVPSGPGQEMLSNCVAKSNHEYPTVGTKFVGQTVPFKIEAVDHEGNIALWPTQPSVTIAPSSLVAPANTDECAFCLVTEGDPGSACRGKPGLIVTDPANGGGWPPGPLCQNLP